MKGATRRLARRLLADVHGLLTTVWGLLLAALISTQVDYAKLLAGDRQEIAKVIAAMVVAANGWSTNKRNPA